MPTFFKTMNLFSQISNQTPTIETVNTGVDVLQRIVDMIDHYGFQGVASAVFVLVGAIILITQVYSNWLRNKKAQKISDDYRVKQEEIQKILFDDFIGKMREHQVEEKRKEIDKHTNAYKWRLTLPPKVNKLLESLIKNTGASRALVAEFRNGSYNISGLPMSRMDCTFERVNRDLETKPAIHTLQNLPLSALSSFTERLINRKAVNAYDLQVLKKDDPSLYEFMKNRGVNALSASAIEGESNQTGFVCVEFDSNNPNLKDIDSNKVKREINRVAGKLSVLLNYESELDIEE